MTLGERLEFTSGRPTGFDYMRVVLAVAVIFWHTIATSYGNAAQDYVQTSAWRPLSGFILPMFFALSGFLVDGSLERCRSIVGFLGLRFIRIYPALAVEVILSAFLLGPLLTTTPLGAYFADPKFFEYLLNITGHIHYELPGLFLNNPNPDRVNGQLWTVPFELLCYISIAGLAAVSLVKRRVLFVVAVTAMWAIATSYFIYKHGFGEGRATNIPGYLLVITFLAGIGVYIWRDKIAWSGPLALLAAVLGFGLLLFPVVGDAFVPLPLAYLTVWIGLFNPTKIRLLRGADYSYGIFLYGYVIQQAWMSISPSLHHWYLNALLTLPVVTIFAAISWHCVEKPALRMRAGVRYVEDHWIRQRERFVQPMLGRLVRPALRDGK